MAFPKHHGKNLRKGRVSQPDRIYSITTVVRQREPIFENFQAARSLIRVLSEHEQYEYAKTLCFVVMPDHLHWLMELGNKKKLDGVIQSIKSLTSKRIGRRVWQKGFYDHALRDEENIKNIA